MWIIAKIKNNSYEIFVKELEKKIQGKVNFYQPKLSIKSKVKSKLVSKYKPLLDNYIFCFHENFSDKNNLTKYSFTRGLKFFLNESKYAQSEIKDFIDYCKNFEDEFGFIKNIFF